MVADLDDLDALLGDKVVFFILETYGEGELVDDAVEFYDLVTSKDPPFSTEFSHETGNHLAIWGLACECQCRGGQVALHLGPGREETPCCRC